MRVKALQYMYYNKRGYNAGEEYDMDSREEAEAKLLATLGKIEIVKQYQTTAMKPQPQSQPQSMPPEQEQHQQSQPVKPMSTEDNSLTAPERRTYRRRDMRPEK